WRVRRWDRCGKSRRLPQKTSRQIGFAVRLEVETLMKFMSVWQKLTQPMISVPSGQFPKVKKSLSIWKVMDTGRLNIGPMLVMTPLLLAFLSTFLTVATSVWMEILLLTLVILWNPEATGTLSRLKSNTK